VPLALGALLTICSGRDAGVSFVERWAPLMMNLKGEHERPAAALAAPVAGHLAESIYTGERVMA
jgi:hypothetical protein